MSAEKNHVLDLVDDYLHGLLEPDEAERVRQHCSTCASCRAELERAQQRFDLLAAAPMAEVPEELIQKTMSRVTVNHVKPGPFRTTIYRACYVLAAAAVLLVVGLNHHYRQMTASPYDLKVYGQQELMSGTQASLRIGLLDRSSGLGLSGVGVQLTLVDLQSNQQVRLAELTTDADGSARPQFTLPDWEQGQYELRVTARAAGNTEVLHRKVTLKRSWKLMLTTDKPLYQPGQTIRIRALALRRPDLKPVAGQEATFSITDPKGNVIYRQREVTSRFGITSTDCPLAAEIIEGRYTVACRIGDTGSAVAVEVAKYVLPKFKIAVDLDHPYYQPGQKVESSVQVDYFFGKPVADATVRAVLTAGEAGQSPAVEVETKTDETGKAKFEFSLPGYLIGRQGQSGDAQFRIEVTVTDAAGQEQSTAITRVVTDQPIRVEVIPESGTLVRGVTNTVYLFTSYADGRPAQTRVAILGQRQEFETNALGVASFELKPNSSPINLNVRATDGQGLVGRREVQLVCGTAAEDFLVRTDRAVYTGGDTVDVIALGGGREPVFLDFLKDRQTVLSRTIDMEQGQGELRFDLPQDLFGTVQLCAYRFDQAGRPVMKLRTIYVHQADELKIDARLDRDEYRPGGKARLTVKLTDQSGRATPGAISLAAVDEAVYHVLTGRPGMEQAFFNLEGELLQPIYAIYGGWSPLSPGGGPSTVDRQRLEQALFSRTARQAAAADPTVPSVRSPLTLVAATFPAKQRQVERERDAILSRVNTGWWAVALLALLGIGISKPRPFLVAAAAVGGMVVVLLWFLLIVLVLSGCSRNDGDKFSKDATAPIAAPADQAGAEDFEAERARAVQTEEKQTEPQQKPGPASQVKPVRVRQWFPETLLWRPELITDEKGQASFEFELADSITAWRLSASAVSAEGRLGASQQPIRVFQPFFVDLNLPVLLVQGDEVSVPAVVYNYLDKPNKVELTLKQADWFELKGNDAEQSAVRTIELAAGEVRAVHFRLRAVQAGQHALELTARAADVADAVRRNIEIVPKGQKVEHVAGGLLSRPAQVALTVPGEALPGTFEAIVKLYPSTFSQLVEGMDGIFRRPSGCFEQTSSTTYPNVLALQYLKETGKSVPAVEAKARQYIHLGYQRLLTFEVAGGGFDWFGHSPAKTALTAYGLMEFTDMARVHDVDPRLIERTRNWLLSKRRPNGSWPADHRIVRTGLSGGPQWDGGLDLATTAYNAWAVFGMGHANGQYHAEPTLHYLRSQPAGRINNSYVLALTANAILAIKPSGHGVGPYLDRLMALKHTGDGGKLIWWSISPHASTAFYGSGQAGNIEATALAVLAMIAADHSPAAIQAALNWLVTQRDANGTWRSTQATILALKALIAAASAPARDGQPRKIQVALDGQVIETVVIGPDQADVVSQLNVTKHLSGKNHTLTLTEQSGLPTGYQTVWSYYLPEKKRPSGQPLSIDVSYNRTTLAVNDTITATVTVRNNMQQDAPMVIVDLPTPAGFQVHVLSLGELQAAGKIARYQITARSAIVYLRNVPTGQSLILPYRLTATMPVKLTVPAAAVYEYYDPDKRATSRPIELTVNPRAF